MNRPLKAWNRIGVLLLAAIAGSSSCLADAPDWVDDQMLFLWPAALSGAVDSAVIEAESVSWGHSSFTDGEHGPSSSVGGGHVESAQWWNTERCMAEPTATTGSSVIEPTSALSVAMTDDPTYVPCSACECWQILPAGVLYRSYIAGEKEPRMGAAFLNDRNLGNVFEATIGGRLGLIRYGTPGPFNPQGWEWDLEGAAMLRQNIEHDLDVEATDFRVGSVITWRRGGTAVKAGYYHLSSHVGDEFLLRNPMFPRLNYVRDSLLIGVYRNLTDALAIYGEIAYAVNTDGGAEPIELQFGTEYTPYDPTRSCGAPFVAVNGHLREELNFGGSVNVLAGWQWIGPTSNHRLRIGGQYYNGKELQWAFFDESVQFLGVGIWFDF